MKQSFCNNYPITSQTKTIISSIPHLWAFGPSFTGGSEIFDCVLLPDEELGSSVDFDFPSEEFWTVAMIILRRSDDGAWKVGVEGVVGVDEDGCGGGRISSMSGSFGVVLV